MDNREPRKRVVLRQADGVYRIVGLFDPSIHEVRATVEYRYAGHDDIIVAKLEGVYDRLIMYRQVEA